MKILLEADEYTALLGSSPTNMVIPADTPASEQHKIPLAMLAPPYLVALLLNPPFLSATAAYALVQA